MLLVTTFLLLLDLKRTDDLHLIIMEEKSTTLPKFSTSNVLAGIFIYVVLSLVVSLIRAPCYPTSIPWVGYGKGRSANLINAVAAYFSAEKWLREGYEHNKNGRSYVLPSHTGFATEIVVPVSQIPWLIEQPDSVLSTSMSHYDTLHGDYSFLNKDVLRDPFHEHVIHKHLARNLGVLIPSLSQEVVLAMDEAFGKDTTEWKNVNLLQALLTIVPILSNSVFVGTPLCRNRKYIENCVKYTDDVVRNMFIFGITPKAIKAAVGPLAALPGQHHFRQTAKFTFPLITARLEQISGKERAENGTRTEPSDYITWHIRTAQAEGRHDELTVKRIAERLMPLNFAAIHTTAITCHGVLLDILSTDPALGVLESLKEEVERVYREDGQQWTKPGLARLYRTDSAIRESMRMGMLMSTALLRKVIAPEGITNPAEGWHAPYGTTISSPLRGAHTDPSFHDSPYRFDPFRFSREREVYEAKAAEEKDPREGLKLRAQGMVTTSDRHFPFGHGRHACPGRFLVAHELKMIIAHLLMNYDLKMLVNRPQPRVIGKLFIPPTDASMEVRRKRL